MVDVRCNFKTGKVDLNCRKCQQVPETQQHIFVCPEVNELPDTGNYMDLFGKNLEKLICAGKHLRKCYNLVITIVHSSEFRAGAATM